MPDWDTTNFLLRVRDRTRVPSTRSGYGDADTLRVAYDELVSQVVPMLVSQQQEHLVSSGRIALVEGQRDYRLPARASGARARLVELEDSSGDTLPLTRLNPEDLSGVRVSTTLGMPTGFTVEGNLVRLYPKPSGVSGFGLRVRFYDRPGKLIAPAGAATVVTTGVTITIANEAIFGGDGSFLVDFVRATPAFETIRASQFCQLIGTSLDPGDTALVSSLDEGDYVCLPGQSPVPQVPPEFHALLVLQTAYAQLQAKGDSDAAKPLLEEMAGRREPLARALSTPRSDGNPQKQANGKRRWGIGSGRWW
jgi:hypothetical protein